MFYVSLQHIMRPKAKIFSGKFGGVEWKHYLRGVLHFITKGGDEPLANP